MSRRYGINVGMGFRESCAEQADVMARVGFSACFVQWEPKGERLPAQAAHIRAAGLELASVHAPFTQMHTLWEEGGEGDRQTEELACCLRQCGQCGVPVVVMHAIIGFERHQPNALGLRRCERLLKVAEKEGVVIAFENTEGEEYLQAVMQEFRGCAACGFCLDTGHEQCYNGGRDMLADYGDRLVFTHLNDNLGQTDPTRRTWLDDAHLLPGDGSIDWRQLRKRLETHGYQGLLTMELTRQNKPDRHTHGRYADWSLEQFLAQALAQARAIFD